jgi:hypothetical protein
MHEVSTGSIIPHAYVIQFGGRDSCCRPTPGVALPDQGVEYLPPVRITPAITTVTANVEERSCRSYISRRPAGRRNRCGTWDRTRIRDVVGRARRLVVARDLGARTDGSGFTGDDPAAEVTGDHRRGRPSGRVRGRCLERCGAQSLVDAALDSFGKLDAVINNAEIVRTADFLDILVEGLSGSGCVLLGMLRLCRAAWPHLVASELGRTDNTVSAAMFVIQ